MDPRCVSTINEMLKDRGFNEEFIFNTEKEFYIIDNKVCIYIVETPKIGINIVKSLQSFVESHDLNHAILFYKDSITAFAKQQLDELKKTLKIETFNINEMIFNITKHVLVPKHELISNKDKKDLLKIFKITEKKLPYIKIDDPVSRYYGASVGNVFKITRTSESTNSTTYYRIVVK